MSTISLDMGFSSLKTRQCGSGLVLSHRWLCAAKKLQYHLDQRMRPQRAVDLVKLLAAGGGDGDGHTQVLAALALAQLNGGGIKDGIELMGDLSNGMHQTLGFKTHDFDREKRRVLNQRLGAWLVGRGHGCLR